MRRRTSFLPTEKPSFLSCLTSFLVPIEHAYLSLTASTWFATADLTVALVGNVSIEAIDAPTGVTIRAIAAEGCRLAGDYTLHSGGQLSVASLRKEENP